MEELLQQADQQTLARIQSLRGPGASAWLQSIPKSQYLSFTNQEWLLAHRFRRDLIPQDDLKACICGYDFTQQDACYSHWHTCPKYRRTTINHRHDTMHRLIQSFHHTAGIMTSDHLGRENNLVPDGLQLLEPPNYSDFTCRHPLAQSHLADASNPAKILDKAVMQKTKKYELWCQNRGATFTAHAILSYGMLSIELINHLKKVAKHAATCCYSRISDYRKYMREMVERISVTLAKCNAWIYRKGIMDSGCIIKNRAPLNNYVVKDIVNTRRNEKRFAMLIQN